MPKGNLRSILRTKFRKLGSGLQVEFAELSDCGRVREHNEDFLGHVIPNNAAEAHSHGWLFALADGVGGQEKGEVASRLAVESLLDGFRSNSGGEAHSTLLPRLIQKANTRVCEAGHVVPHATGMATTLVACSLRFDRAVVVHVGDSRCYLIRHGQATALTRDHTIAGEQQLAGILSAKEAQATDARHVLSRCLGAELFVNADISEHLLLPGDVLLQCSDGLHGAVPSSQIAATLGSSRHLSEAAQQLVSIANERDGSDNVSVQIMRIRSVERVGMYRGRPYKLR